MVKDDPDATNERLVITDEDDLFPVLALLRPGYRFPIVLIGLCAAVLLSTITPTLAGNQRLIALAVHVTSVVVALGAVLVVDWHGLLWLLGRRGLNESTRLAAATGPLIWGGLAGLAGSGAFLKPDLSAPWTLVKLVLVLMVAWNGAAMSMLRRRLSQLPTGSRPTQIPRRDWRFMMAATVVSQIGWWGAVVIGFLNTASRSG